MHREPKLRFAYKVPVHIVLMLAAALAKGGNGPSDPDDFLRGLEAIANWVSDHEANDANIVTAIQLTRTLVEDYPEFWGKYFHLVDQNPLKKVAVEWLRAYPEMLR